MNIRMEDVINRGPCSFDIPIPRSVIPRISNNTGTEYFLKRTEKLFVMIISLLLQLTNLQFFQFYGRCIHYFFLTVQSTVGTIGFCEEEQGDGRAENNILHNDTGIFWS